MSLTNAEVSVYSMDARLVSTQRLSSLQQINISTLPKGNYVLRLATEGASFQKLFTKK
jgi:hypothetical protein